MICEEFKCYGLQILHKIVNKRSIFNTKYIVKNRDLQQFTSILTLEY